jgi:hypothetical protein
MLELESWLTRLTRLWEERYAALDQVLREEQQKLNGISKGDST